jgi:hypothetical protein
MLSSVRGRRLEVLQSGFGVADPAPRGRRLPLRGASRRLSPGHLGLRLGTPAFQLGQLVVEVLHGMTRVTFRGLRPFQMILGPLLGY